MQVSRLKHWLVIMSLLTPTVAFADEVITKAQELMKAGDYKAAYELLEPLETERSGDVQYDMPIAAITKCKWRQYMNNIGGSKL